MLWTWRLSRSLFLELELGMNQFHCLLGTASTDSSPSQYPYKIHVRFTRWLGRIRYAGVVFITIVALD
jgi:hypothetical protein